MSSTIPSSGSTGTGKSGGTPNDMFNNYQQGVQGATGLYNQGPDQQQMGDFNNNIAQGQSPGLSNPQQQQMQAQNNMFGGSTGTGKSMNMGGPYTPYMPQPDVMPQDAFNQYGAIMTPPPANYQLGPDQQQQMQAQNQFFTDTLSPQQGLNQVLQQYQPPMPTPGQITPTQASPGTRQLTQAIAAPTQARPQPVAQPRPQPMLNRPQVVARPAPRPQPVQQVRQAAYPVSRVNPPISRGIRR